MAELDFDVLVVGSGAAGLSAALRAADLTARVGVLTAGAVLAGSSPRAQGGVAAAVGADDAPALHAADTLSVGAGLNDTSAVDVLTSRASHSIHELGTLFEPDLGLEAGHARRRILHAGGGATGQVLTSALLERALARPEIQLYHHAPASALETVGGAVVGVRVGRWVYRARAVILATGGYAALWGRSTNAPETRGTGLSLAWQAGATLTDLEFVQFHPTALSLTGRPAFLLSEALRGEGARLVDEYGADVVDPLLPRDVVARALYRHGRSHGPVFLSLQHLDPSRVDARFERLAETLREFGLDLARDRLPVAPAAHYCMGGIRTDTWGRTDARGLYAAGEVACSGAQGANRLASNSLLECLVFGARAAEAALTDPIGAHAAWRTKPLPPLGYYQPANYLRDEVLPPVHHEPRGVLGGPPPIFSSNLRAFRPERLDADLGVERDAHRLECLVAELPEPEAAPSSDLLLTSLIARAALLRRESRGAHFRADAPESDPAWRGRIHWRRDHPPVFEEVVS
jgi:L-aspartate oxidase